MNYIQLSALLLLLQNICSLSCQVIVFRSNHDDEFHVKHPGTQCEQAQQIWTWTTASDFNIMYPDNTKITVSSDVSPGYFDITVNGEYTHTCTFRNEERSYAILFHLFRKGSKIKVASSPDSLCTQAFYDDPSFNYILHHGVRTRPKPSTPLRIAVLRRLFDY